MHAQFACFTGDKAVNGEGGVEKELVQANGGAAPVPLCTQPLHIPCQTASDWKSWDVYQFNRLSCQRARMRSAASAAFQLASLAMPHAWEASVGGGVALAAKITGTRSATLYFGSCPEPGCLRTL